MKKCNKCGLTKDKSDFGKNKRSKDGLHFICKSCKREIDNKWNSQHREQRSESSKQWRKDNPDKLLSQRLQRKEYLISLKKPCVKCGESRPSVIEFHHVDPSTKLFSLAYVISTGSKPKSVIDAELEKCVCLCANCHSEFHELYGQQPDDPVAKFNEYISY